MISSRSPLVTNMTPDDVRAALTARQELAKAVSDGGLTQEQAGQMMAQMKLHLEQVTRAFPP
jgi:hypothetical protein